ncbi:MAG: hypothetical protein DRH57_07170 [Candidatus Cloacimonadota bacterium]|nr:MAG: hypothetical protein DRH57_07170 [Candidatus Cloacimonadota bacterium]
MKENEMKSKGTILVVDDEELVRDIASALLSTLGYTVIVADDGEQALKIYQERQNEIDVVFLDITMPKMDGKKTQQRLKQINPQVKTVISSGYDIDINKGIYKDLGFADFISKPYSIHKLSKVIENLIK